MANVRLLIVYDCAFHDLPRTMPSAKRHLTGEDLAKIDFVALGIEARRVPPIEWDWPIDHDRQILCTQLISEIYEMREGYYRYLLILCGQPVVFKVDAFGSVEMDGKTCRKAALNYLKYSEQAAHALERHSLERHTLEKLADEAHQALSHQGEPLSFSGFQYASSS